MVSEVGGGFVIADDGGVGVVVVDGEGILLDGGIG